MSQETMFIKPVLSIVKSIEFKWMYKEWVRMANREQWDVEDYGLDMINFISNVIESEYKDSLLWDILDFTMREYRRDYYNTCIMILSRELNLNTDDLLNGSDSFFG